MAKTKRTSIQIERDREEIASLYVRRTPQHRIAAILNDRRRTEYEKLKEKAELASPEEWPSLVGVQPGEDIPEPYELTRQMIGYDLDAIREEWRKNRTLNIDDHIARQLASIDELESYAWRQLERCEGTFEAMKMSTEDIEISGKDDATGLRVDLPARKVKQEKKREQLLPEARWGMIIDRCLERREKTLGLAAAVKIEHTGTLTLADLVKNAAEEATKESAA